MADKQEKEKVTDGQDNTASGEGPESGRVKKKKTFAQRIRRGYLDDFKMNEHGRYEFRGQYMISELDKDEFKKRIMLLWVLVLVPFALALISGNFDTGLNGHPLILIPYAGGVVFAACMMWS
ncbi:MAG: hypothetical protein IJL97_00470, partial [Lachnospiraceae bacterium]|nr:hypothetical protein [Lachnospiraceae bacterium]